MSHQRDVRQGNQLHVPGLVHAVPQLTIAHAQLRLPVPMDLTCAVAAFLQQCRQQQRASATIDLYHYQLSPLWLPWRAQQGLPAAAASLTLTELQTYREYLASSHVNGRTG